MGKVGHGKDGRQGRKSILHFVMIAFLITAMRAPGRQLSFRRLAILHVTAVLALVYFLSNKSRQGPPEIIGYLTLVLGLLEGATLIGWRLAQLPKSQALEFLLVSPVRPKRLFLMEAAVGVARFLLVQMTALPIWVLASLDGIVEWIDFIPYALMPAIWGITLGLVLTTWIYESRPVRVIGEVIGLVGVLVYLVVGLLVGEQIRGWLLSLPDALGQFLFQSIMALHHGNPFGIIRSWFTPGSNADVIWEQFLMLHGITLAVLSFAVVRAAHRLQPHFQDRHYAQLSNDRDAESESIGDRPLSWWAVRRVMEYSGRVNLWLAIGVAGLYSAYTIAGEHWPPQLGRMVFLIFESWGGPAAMATMMCVLGCVPAVFQYGLWDSTTQDRCRRLELLLLSDLNSRDYAHAALAAAWARGRGYFFAAGLLWIALGISGSAYWFEVLMAAFGSLILSALSFAIGFRSFSKGAQTSGIASMFTMGMPILLVLLNRMGHGAWGALLPHGWTYAPLKTGLTWTWFVGIGMGLIISIWFLRTGLNDCVRDLQIWYDRNHGKRSVE